MRNVLLDLEKTAKSLYGIDLAYYDEAFLKQTVERRCEVLGVKGFQDYLEYIWVILILK